MKIKKIAKLNELETNGAPIKENGGTLKVDKNSKDGKYYWTFKFKSGKKDLTGVHGFNNKADAQRDFMHKIKYIKENIKESVKLSDVLAKFKVIKGTDLRDKKGQVYAFYHGPNSLAKKWAGDIKKEFPKGIVFIDTAKLKEALSKNKNTGCEACGEATNTTLKNKFK